jgi:hypothetical protein
MKDEKAKNAEALSEWMFVSIDKEGKVMLSTISKNMFMLKTNKYPIIETDKFQNADETRFQTVSCRFRNSLYPQAKINDLVTLIAVANMERVLVMAIGQGGKTEVVKEILRPHYKDP